MAVFQLQLLSSHGDQTLPQVRFVAHATANAHDTAAVLRSGLKFQEGRSVVSTNLVYAHQLTKGSSNSMLPGGGAVSNEPGSVVICALPSQFHLGYGVFTHATIDRQVKLVMGSPWRYQAGRNQLALYLNSDTEATRAELERQEPSFEVNQRPEFNLESQYIVGSFGPGPALDACVAQIDVALRSLEPLDYDRLESALRELFIPRIAADVVLVPTIIRDLLVGTAESTVMSRLRLMRWQGLALLGYRFREAEDRVDISQVASIAGQRASLDEFGRRLASSPLFAGELAWLKSYGLQQLELMRVELEGAE